MGDLLAEYIQYYETRMNKYRESEVYKHSYETERAMYEAIASCKELGEFKEKVESGNLTVNNAIAMVKDKEIAFRDLYTRIKEVVRAKGSDRTVREIDKAKTDMEVATLAAELEQQSGIEITIDQFTDEFYSDFDMLETIEVLQNCEVPDEWKPEIAEKVDDMIQKGQEEWRDDIVENARNWKPDWTFDYDLVWEERHRRNIPMPDELVKKRIEQHKQYRGT